MMDPSTRYSTRAPRIVSSISRQFTPRNARKSNPAARSSEKARNQRDLRRFLTPPLRPTVSSEFLSASWREISDSVKVDPFALYDKWAPLDVSVNRPHILSYDAEKNQLNGGKEEDSHDKRSQS